MYRLSRLTSHRSRSPQMVGDTIPLMPSGTTDAKWMDLVLVGPVFCTITWKWLTAYYYCFHPLSIKVVVVNTFDQYVFSFRITQNSGVSTKRTLSSELQEHMVISKTMSSVQLFICFTSKSLSTYIFNVIIFNIESFKLSLFLWPQSISTVFLRSKWCSIYLNGDDLSIDLSI